MTKWCVTFELSVEMLAKAVDDEEKLQIEVNQLKEADGLTVETHKDKSEIVS